MLDRDIQIKRAANGFVMEIAEKYPNTRIVVFHTLQEVLDETNKYFSAKDESHVAR